MKSLEEFLSLPDVSGIEEEVLVSKRLGKFKVRAMTADDQAEYQKRSMIRTKDGTELDRTKFMVLVAAGQTVSPKFNDAELLKKANCTTASDFIKKKLLPGEIAELANKISEISGFDTEDFDEEIEDAKN